VALSYGFDPQFGGAYPRNSGAINSVTGGPPEDMNGMPIQTLDKNIKEMPNVKH
jgi:hypothetical protein